ncbi:quinolinate synthase NadA [Candidatus Bathyarchaeota archaeon]|nr:quinolinate synthase NadA [Candidatus Bathyarchaeota archaeon]
MEVSQLQRKVIHLKEKEKALILAHNYQRPEIQEIADFVGDSLQLCFAAIRAEDAKYIVFCGVDFMAETASILNPDKPVVIPDVEAKCPMVAQLPAKKVVEAKKKYPDAEVMLYINTLAEAKAEADVICTSSNAFRIASKLDSTKVLFGPDRNLAWYTAKRCSNKEIIPIPENGYCIVHKLFQVEDILLLKKSHPDAEVLVHPECDPEVQQIADFIGSTEQMRRRCFESHSKKFIITTEIGLIDRLKRELPGKEYIPAFEGAICYNMKRHTLEKVYHALESKKTVVKVPEDIAKKARLAIERMMGLSKQ